MAEEALTILTARSGYTSEPISSQGRRTFELSGSTLTWKVNEPIAAAAPDDDGTLQDLTAALRQTIVSRASMAEPGQEQRISPKAGGKRVFCGMTLTSRRWQASQYDGATRMGKSNTPHRSNCRVQSVGAAPEAEEASSGSGSGPRNVDLRHEGRDPG